MCMTASDSPSNLAECSHAARILVLIELLERYSSKLFVGNGEGASPEACNCAGIITGLNGIGRDQAPCEAIQ